MLPRSAAVDHCQAAWSRSYIRSDEDLAWSLHLGPFLELGSRRFKGVRVFLHSPATPRLEGRQPLYIGRVDDSPLNRLWCIGRKTWPPGMHA
jgi:hypothetical protein